MNKRSNIRRGLFKVVAGLISIPVVHAIVKHGAEMFPEARTALLSAFFVWTVCALLFSISAAIATAVRARRPESEKS
jgi:hypothetical protein